MCQFYWFNGLISNWISDKLPQIVNTSMYCFNGHHELLILLVGGVRIVLTNPASPLYMYVFVCACVK